MLPPLFSATYWGMIGWTDIGLMLRGGAIGLELLIILILWRDHRHTSAGRIAMLFLVSVICHVITTMHFRSGWPNLVEGLTELGSNAAPGLFWLMARAWFGDERPGWRSWALVGVSIALMQLHGAILASGAEAWIYPTGIAARGAAIGLAGLGLYVAWRRRGEDLIEERRRLRTYGTAAIGFYIVLVLIVEIGMRPGLLYTPEAARAWLVAGIFLLTLGATAAILSTTRADLFGPPKRAGGEVPEKEEIDTALAAKLDAYMAAELAWRTDGLTIADLARRLGTQEYRLRRLINRQLGHRNFAAFLNRYRLEEVRAALADPSQRDVPILTIALDAGFGSLGPFNRAFREAEGMTPSEYRNSRIG